MNEQHSAGSTDERAKKNGELPAGNGACGVSGDSTIITKGLSKRELFAAMAMQGILTRGTMGTEQSRAENAVSHADALLKELAK